MRGKSSKTHRKPTTEKTEKLSESEAHKRRREEKRKFHQIVVPKDIEEDEIEDIDVFEKFTRKRR